ncbi:MAG: hypothetical protein FWE12_02595 [Oscillospiraceae bacterium]|nr:hypothetical protein [Oscillospiraceae bacterium]
MTHSLHRSGNIECQKKDFIWFMYQTKSVNDKDIKPKAVQFIAVAEAQGSPNWGDVKTGPRTRFSCGEIIEKITDKSRIRGVFTSKEQVIGFLKDIKRLDLGQSVIITGVLTEVLPACQEVGVKIHSINYALGIWGKKENLPDEETLSITTMCGHHMIPPKFVQHMVSQVEKGKITAEDASRQMSDLCYCGIFNQVRCAKIVKEMAGKK